MTCPTQTTTTVNAECITRQDEDYYYKNNSGSCCKLYKATCINVKLDTNATKTTLISVACPTKPTTTCREIESKTAGSFAHHLLIPLILHLSKSLKHFKFIILSFTIICLLQGQIFVTFEERASTTSHLSLFASMFYLGLERPYNKVQSISLP